MISAGTTAQVEWGDGNWIFLDIGFSSKKKSCGLLVRDGKPRCLTFAAATAEITKEIARTAASNLVIEAPLSVCFDSSGNPKRRSIEIQVALARYWYMGLGCAVMVASMYLLREVSALTEPSVRLFEGFVSYKSAERSDHLQDVLDLQAVVRDPIKFADSIYEADRLKEGPDDILRSAFSVMGMDCEVPTVIKPNSKEFNSPPTPFSPPR
jgi:hypothetical protein